MTGQSLYTYFNIVFSSCIEEGYLLVDPCTLILILFSLAIEEGFRLVKLSLPLEMIRLYLFFFLGARWK